MLRVPADTDDDSCVEYSVLRGECIGCCRLHVGPSRGSDGGLHGDVPSIFKQLLNI